MNFHRLLIRKAFMYGTLGLLAIALQTNAVLAQTADSAPDASTPASNASQVASNDAGAFKDVPLDNPAYQLLQDLSADGLVKGYPEGTFKGNRPLTRYEMAIIVHRTADYVRDLLVADKKVSSDDLARLEQLVTAFESDISDVKRRVSTLEKTSQATAAQVAAIATQTAANTDALNAFHIRLTDIARSGTFYQNVGAVNGPTTLRGGTIAAGSALPAGVGPAPLGNGLLGSVSPGASGSQNAFVVGPYQHGVTFDDFRLTFFGAVDSHLTYFLRLEDLFKPSAANYQTTTTPSYCTSTGASAVSGVNACSAQSYNAGTASVRVQQAFVNYSTPGGLYMKLGRWQDDEGAYNEITQVLGAFVNGLQVGYTTPRFSTYVAYGAGLTALSNTALNNSGCPYLNANCVDSTQSLFQAKADYLFTKRTQLGFAWDNDIGYPGSEWNPSAGLCAANTGSTATAVTTMNIHTACPTGTHLISTVAGPVTGAYQTAAPTITTSGVYLNQFFGKKVKLTLEASHRFGDDPFTGTSWLGANQYSAVVDYATGGNFFLGPLFPAPGIAKTNVIEAGFVSTGLNAEGPDDGYTAFIEYNQPFYSNLSGLQTEWLSLQHWLSPYARVGVVYQHFGNIPNVDTPAGSLTCPGCYVNFVNANALYAELYVNTR